MKRLLSILVILAVVAVMSATTLSCDSNERSKTSETKTESIADDATQSTVMAYYFHATRRCETCESVERVAKETILENYKGQVDFVSINREEDKNKAMVKKYQVNGQTLLLVKGEKIVDLTGPAFMYARNNPDKLKAKLKSAIESMQ